MEWLLVRYAPAEGQAADAPLTEAGKQAAIALAEVLISFQPDQVVTSPYRRAKDTMAPFLDRSGLLVCEDDRLRERVLSLVPREDWIDHLGSLLRILTIVSKGRVQSRGDETGDFRSRGMGAIECQSGGDRHTRCFAYLAVASF